MFDAVGSADAIMGAVRGIFHPLALALFRNCVAVEVVSLGQFPVAHRLGLRL